MAVDASVLLEASKNDDGAAVPRWAAVLARHASDSIKEPARGLASLLEPYVGRPAAESIASMASVLLLVHFIRRYFLGRSLLLVKEHGAYHLKASLGSLLGLAFLVFIVFALAAAAAEVDDEEPCSALRYARSKGGCVDVRPWTGAGARPTLVMKKKTSRD